MTVYLQQQKIIGTDKKKECSRKQPQNRL